MTKEKPLKKKMGRPPIQINWDEVKKLCKLQCTAEEIAGWMNISVDTLENKLRTEQQTTFSVFFKMHSAGGKVSLRRAQYSTAIKGNAALLIWLGKQYLGQSDKLETMELTPPEPKQIIFTVQDARVKQA